MLHNTDSLLIVKNHIRVNALLFAENRQESGLARAYLARLRALSSVYRQMVMENNMSVAQLAEWHARDVRP